MNKSEAVFHDAVRELGCIACRVWLGVSSPCEVHHILSGGRRVGEMHVLGLCTPHHRSGRNDDQIVSRHPWKRAFEKRYGSENALLAKTRELVKAMRPLTAAQMYRNRELHGHFGAGHS